MPHRLVILTGASGSGKTTVASRLRLGTAPQTLQVFSFDTIGVPPTDEMTRRFGSGENWQRQATRRWIAKLSKDHLPATGCLLEGQMRIAFILEALQEAGIETYEIVLIDCSDDIRRQRLTEQRHQPQLATEQMISWAAFLRREATAHRTKVIDTSFLSVEEATELIRVWTA